MRLLLILVATVCAHPIALATIPWTPVIDTGLTRVQVSVPPAYASVDIRPGVNDVWVPAGWKASIFFAGKALSKPRFLAWGPDSVLYVANMSRNNVLAMPDYDHDGIADTSIVATTVPPQTSSITFFRDTLFVGSESGVRKYWRSSGTGHVYDKSVVVIDKTLVPSQLGGNHRTRTVVVDSVHNKLYLNIGSRGNAAREADRGMLEEFELDGSAGHMYAHGTRNAIGLTLHPRTGQLWANCNGSDLQGNDVPPEWVDQIRPSGFYGYPVAYHMGNWFNFDQGDYKGLLPITATDSMNVASMVPPAALVAAHSAPMQLVFSNDYMPSGFRTGAFMAMRGSWNRLPVSGNKLVYLQFDDDNDTIANYVMDVCTGFLTDSTKSDARWARPVGVALSTDGSIYLTSDDLKMFVLRLVPPKPTSVPADQGMLQHLEVFPNPSADHVTITVQEPVVGCIEVVDALGQTVISQPIDGMRATLHVYSLTAGSYSVVGQFSHSIARASLRVLR